MSSHANSEFAEWAAFDVEDVQGLALLDTGASRTVGGYTMFQHVIGSLLLQPTLTWMDLAETAVKFTFAGGETSTIWDEKCGFSCQEQTQNSSVYVVPSKATPILFGLGIIWD